MLCSVLEYFNIFSQTFQKDKGKKVLSFMFELKYTNGYLDNWTV